MSGEAALFLCYPDEGPVAKSCLKHYAGNTVCYVRAPSGGAVNGGLLVHTLLLLTAPSLPAENIAVEQQASGVWGVHALKRVLGSV